MALANLARVAKQTIKKTVLGGTALIISLSGLAVAAPLFLAQPAYATATTWTVTGSGSCNAGDHNCSTIAAAVTAAADGDTISLPAGTYDQGSAAISITKSLTFVGPNSAVSPVSGSRSSEAIIEGTANGGPATFEINSSSVSVTFEGIEFNVSGAAVRSDYPGATIDFEKDYFTGTMNDGMYFDDSNLTINDSLFKNISSPSADVIQMGVTGASRVGATHITGNEFSNITSGGAGGVFNLSDISGTISGNTFDTVGDYAVTLANNASLTITNNTFNKVTNGSTYTDAKYALGAGVRFYQDSAATSMRATITGNTFSNSDVGIGVRHDADISSGSGNSVAVSSNKFTSDTKAVYVDSTATGTLAAANNYWGSANPSFGSIISGSVTYTPWYTDVGLSGSSTADTVTGLSLSSGTLSPSFSPSTTSYSTTVANSVTSITATATGSAGITTSLSSNASNLAVGSNTVTVTVSSADGTVHQTYTVTVTRAAATQTLPDSSGNATISNSTPTLVVTSSSTPLTVTVSSGTTNATIDYSALKNGNTATVPQTTVQTANATIQIQSGTTITASGSWDGTIKAPTILANSTVSLGVDKSVASVIEVGSDTANLTFDKAVRLLIAGQAGKAVGFERSGVFTAITTACSADSQAVGNALPAGGDCYISVGSDMVVWTKHFTTFVAYTKNNTYTVKYGDTMSSIAYKFGLTLAQLEALNPNAGHPAGNFSLIMPGDVLSVGSAVLTASASTGSGSSVLGNSTGGLIGSAASTTKNSSPQVKSAKTTASAASATAASKWYWWAIAVVIIAALGTVWYIYRLADNDKKSA